MTYPFRTVSCGNVEVSSTPTRLTVTDPLDDVNVSTAV